MCSDPFVPCDPMIPSSVAGMCSDPVIPAVPADRALVLDTNIVLDLFVFQDSATDALRHDLAQPDACWLATAAMREELARVLDYPQIARRLLQQQLAPVEVLARFDAQARIVAVPAKAPVTCKDPDDQKFIDLAVAHRALLLSKDHAVLCMHKRLSALGAQVRSTLH